MGTIGVFDYDFFTYPNVVPNLECAKLLGFYRKKREIAVLAPKFEPERFSQFFIRKEYDDGIYPREWFKDGIVYGGRAFTKNQYQPLPLEIEHTDPDFSSYSSYIDNFNTYFNKLTQDRDKLAIQRLLKSRHLRLSLDEKTIDPFWLNKKIEDNNTPGFIFHDYNLGEIEGAFNWAKKRAFSRYTKNEKEKPYKIGTKYPITTSSEEDFFNWLSLPGISDFSYVQFNGFLSKEGLEKIDSFTPSNKNRIIYNPVYGCSSENDFLKNRLLEFYEQVLFLRRDSKEISLIYEEKNIQSEDLEKFINFLNLYLHLGAHKVKGETYTLTSYIKILKKRGVLPLRGIDEIFLRRYYQKIREVNYECFKLFYEREA